MAERILIVDDEPTILMFCTRALTRMGYEVQGASSGEEALALLRQGSYDVLVTDISMPGMTGIELLNQARNVMPDLAVIVITGVGSIDVAIRALRGGAQDFLPKPFTPLELKSAVDHALLQVRMAQERARLRVLLPLFDVAKRRLQDVDLTALYGEILTLAMAETSASRAALLGVDEAGQPRLEAEAGPALGVENAGALLSLAQERGEPFVLDAAQAQPEAVRALLQGRGIGSVLCAPLAAPGRLAGLLLLAKPAGEAPFNHSDVSIATILANQVAGLLENARLVTKLANWNRALEQRVEERTQALEQAQQRLLRSERLATVGKLGAGIAHELRNPLGVINNSVYYLRTRLGEAEAKITKHLDIIGHEVQAANKIITDLMNFVRVSDIEKKLADPNEMVAQALERLSVPDAVMVETHLTEPLPQVPVDADKMQQVLINLLNNAVQAMPDGGTLTVSTGQRNGHVLFEVQDTGMGIRAEDLGRIYEPLFTTKAKGIGLGLSLVKLLVEAHQGDVQVSSQEGEGSTFTVRVPYGSGRA